MTSSQNTTSTNTFTTSHRNTLSQLQSTTYGQSFSGSETDVSTSTENLSPEDRYALEHTQRQEPQGQENVGSAVSGMAGTQNTCVSALVTGGATTMSMARSNESNASISSSTNTLIIHNSQADDSWNHRWMPGGFSTPVAGRKSVSSTLNTVTDTINFSSSLMSSPLLLDSTLTQKTSVPSYLSDSIPGSPKLSARSSAMKFHTATDLPDIPSSYLDQSEVLKHLLNRDGRSGKNNQSGSSSNSAIDMLESVGTASKNTSQLPLLSDMDITVNYNNYPPPAYPIWRQDDSEKSEHIDLTKSSLSKSQPDLSRLGSPKEISTPKELLSQRIVSGQTDSSEGHLQERADILARENNALRIEVDMYHRKVAKLQRFEMEIIKVHEAHEALVKLSERREQLERLARHKLHAEVKRLTDLNADLKDQVDVLSTQIASRSLPTDSADALRKELNKRDVFIAQLVSQNKELIAAKERQEIELTAQRQTLNEQRTHIDILDSALTNAQANVVKLEEELRKKQNLVEQAGQLKRLLVSLQLAADRREQSEKNLRHKLEKEIETLRMGFKQEGPDSKLSDLRREIREKEEKIMLLEGEVTKWEQRYLQESAMRQLAIEAASMPKDAKIAALEKTSQESETTHCQAKSDKIRHMDEIHNMNKKQAEYESRNRELETQIAEKNAMIRVLQRRLEEKENVYQNALMRNSLSSGKSMEGRNSSSNTSLVQSHSTQASTAHSYSSSGGVGGAGAGSSAPSTPRRDEELGQERYSNSYLCQNKDYGLLEDDTFGGTSHSSSALTDLNDDLLVDKEDGVLGKLGVVCFPGLAHSGFAAGEGTLSKSLLACVEARSSLLPSSRHNNTDMPLMGIGVGGLDPPSTVRRSYHTQPFESLPSYCMETVNQAPTSQKRDLSLCSQQSYSKICRETSTTLQPVDRLNCDPPPYHGHHELLLQQAGASGIQSLPALSHPAEQGAVLLSSPPLSPNLASDMPLPRPPMCRNPHHPTVACRKCNSVRTSNRQNAAILVRRANSSAGQVNRNSAPVPGSQSLLDTDDAPSILARLRREWHLGNIPPKVKTPSTQATPASSTRSQQTSTCNTKSGSQAENEVGKKTTDQQNDSRNVASPTKVSEMGHFSPSVSNTLLSQNSINYDSNSKSSDSINQSKDFQNNLSVDILSNRNPLLVCVSDKNRNMSQSLNNRIGNTDKVNENNDRNQENNNQESKIELVILEDSDHLKTPQNTNDNSKNSLKNVI
ncbi:LOW QUALITY PROTEIN: serine-rich adhesin for platelets-like [Palaemon carinicauda]|uniref:LOW QUALITY PROTEIN: serine-rich adhesin for platelets-like n=1 Tax=Palaemon carinicauda TaxID=392227 RepID=UPI0035B645E7